MEPSTDNSKLKEETKQVLRSIIESAPYKIYVRDIEREYYKLMGGWIPHLKLGYRNLQDYLRSIPDTVLIIPSIDGPLVRSVACTETKHIDRLVTSQKAGAGRFRPPRKERAIEYVQAPGQIPRSFQNTSTGDYPHYNPPPPIFVPTRKPLLPDPPFAFPQMQQPPLPHLQGPARQPPPFPRGALAYWSPVPMPSSSNNGTSQQEQHAAYNMCMYNVIKGRIVALLSKYPNGLSMDELERYFKEMYGYPFYPCRFGFQTVPDFLGDMPDVVALRNTGSRILAFAKQSQYPPQSNVNFNNPSWGNNNRLGQQKPVTVQAIQYSSQQKPDGGGSGHALKPEMSGDTLARPPQTDNDDGTRLGSGSAETDGQRKVDSPVRTSPPKRPPSVVLQVVNEPREASPKSAEPPPKSPRVTASPALQSTDDHSVSHVIGEKTKTAFLQASPTPQSTDGHTMSHVIGEKMKTAFLQILEQNPNGVLASSLMSEYQKITKQRLDFRDLGFYSIIELVVALPDIFSTRQSKENGEFLLLPAQNKSDDWCLLEETSRCSVPEADLKTELSPRVAISKDLEKKLLQVICSCKGGVVLENFEEVYIKFHDEELDFDTLNYTPEALFLALPHIITLDYKDDRSILVKATPEGERLLGHPRLETSYVLPQGFPGDAVVDASVKFQLQKLPEVDPSDPQKRFIELYVPYAFSPSQFWIQLRGINTSVELDTLMTRLKATYHNAVVSKMYHIPDALLVVGLVCAALYPGDQNWHRAVIVKSEDEEVEVYYIDFGNCGIVSRNAVRFLKTEFMSLPGQALAATLSGIIPYRGDVWTSAAVRRFRDLCLDRPLISTVMKKDSVLSLCLYDTTGETDVRINDTLVTECHATLQRLHQETIQSGHALGRSTDLSLAKSSVATQQTPLPKDFRPQSIWTSSPSTTPVPDSSAWDGAKSPKASTRASEKSSVIVTATGHSIIPTTLVGATFHVVHHGGHVYVPTFDVSTLLWTSDVLFQMLLVLKVRVNYVFVSKSSAPELFENLFQALKKSVCQSSCIVTSIMLCPINSMPDILTAIVPDNTSLLSSFRDLIKSQQT